jgi:signal transduction histidine kinase/CheY-like chemotaxis protein
MELDSQSIRAEAHVTLGALLQRDANLIIDRWTRRAVAEQPHARRVHHEALLDHLPQLLHELSISLAESNGEETLKHSRPARLHGRQRWEAGWSLTEVVQDYQLLRLVLVEYLDQALERPPRSREVMAVGLALDEAIAASVASYVRQVEAERAEQAKRDQDILRREAEALAEANRRKDEFLAVLGHELRNPLAPVRNALHVLSLQGEDRATVEWACHLMDRQVRLMTRLVDDLLDASRIAQGKIVLHRERLDLARLVRETAEDRRGGLEKAGLTLTLDVPAEPVWVPGDPARLAQVVGNLVHNAQKFTDHGGHVTVQLRREPGRAVVVVRDTGIGIEPQLLPRLFETFMQADHNRERSRGGLGLGLALVKGLVELHGGQVQAASAGPGHGAEFILRLPLEQPARTGGDSAPAARRILLVDGEARAAEGLKALLELAGHTVACASSGQAALEAVRQARPDVVLCDRTLAEMDACALAAALRADPATARLPLVAFAAEESEADQQRCRQAGFDVCLAGPPDPAALHVLLANLPPGTQA